MVEFYRDHPEYQFKEAKYIVYMLLFDGIDGQRERVLSAVYDGWGADNSEGQIVGGPKGGTIDYFVDGELTLSIKEVRVAIIHNGIETVYDNINNPETVRLAFEDAGTMGRSQDVIWVDGVPDLVNTPQFYSVKCMFNSFPADTVEYRVEVIDPADFVVLSEQGTINIVDPPWATS